MSDSVLACLPRGDPGETSYPHADIIVSSECHPCVRGTGVLDGPDMTR